MPSRPEPRQLAAFVAVAETGSFVKAAQQLGVSSPAVSQLVARLEAVLALKLFERSSHGVWLTGEGESLLPGARRALNALDRVGDRAVEISQGASGTLRVGTTDGIAAQLEGVLALLQEGYPGTRVRLRSLHTPEKLAALLAGDLDVAFVRQPPATPGLRFDALWTEPLVVVLGSGHPLAASSAIDLADLFEEPAIVSPPAVNPGVFAMFSALTARAGFRPLLGEPFTSRQDALALIAAGAGWTLLPSSTDVSTARVVARPTTDPQATVTVSLALRATGASPLALAFADMALGHGRLGPAPPT